MAMKFLEHFDHPERKQDKEHFIHLIQIALADGQIDDSEEEMLNRVGSNLGLTAPEIADLLKSTKESSYIPPYELSKRFEQFLDVIKMVFADGKIDERELKITRMLAIKSGFDADDVPILLDVLLPGVENGEDVDDLFKLYKKRRMAK